MRAVNYLLDTDLCIYVVNHRPPAIRERLAALPRGSAGISSITFAELAFRAGNSSQVERNLERLQALATTVAVLPFDADAGLAYGRLRADLKRRGELIGPLDMLIAGHALATGLVLVTNNLREFSRVAGLRCETWVEER